jgi:hypothetical protein
MDPDEFGEEAVDYGLSDEYSEVYYIKHDLNNYISLPKVSSIVTSKITHKDLNAPFVGTRKFSREEAVVIYPEITIGNPLQSKNVVRWILNTPGDCAGVRGFYENKKDTDLIFKYSEYFHIKDESESKGLMTTTFIDSDYFYSSSSARKGSAFFVKKGGMKNKIHPDDSIDLSKLENNWKVMGNALRQVEYFYCYDNACFWVVIAAGREGDREASSVLCPC